METNNHQIVDYSAVLEKKFGKPGTEERAKFDEEAYAFYTSQILLDARKNARLTQDSGNLKRRHSSYYKKRLTNAQVSFYNKLSI